MSDHDLGKEVQDEWVDQFVDITDQDFEQITANEANQREFWQKLESEWDSMSKENQETGEHPWLDEYDEVCWQCQWHSSVTFLIHDFQMYSPMSEYKFQEDNMLKNTDNCLEEGKIKLEEGNPL